jgi:hypothetical protein
MNMCLGCRYLLASILLAAEAGAAGATELSPYFTRSAQTQSRVSLELRARYFDEALLQEVENFDGYSLTAELVWPLNPESQLRVILPFYTEGEADYSVLPAEFDIEGYGGTFEFPGLVYERQFLQAAGADEWNAAFSVGVGWVIEPLKVYNSQNTLTDRYNHKGFKAILGTMADREVLDGDWTLTGNLEFEIFMLTDDINPGGDGHGFTLMNLRGALQRQSMGSWVSPAVELLYTESFSDYRNLSLAPALLMPFGDDWGAKLAAPYRLTGDGERYSVGLSVLHRF